MIWAYEGCFCQIHGQRDGKARGAQIFFEFLGVLEDPEGIFDTVPFEESHWTWCVFMTLYRISSSQNSHGFLLPCYLLQYHSSLMTTDGAGACKSNCSWFTYIKGSKLWLHGAKVMTEPKSSGHKSSFHARLGPIIPLRLGSLIAFPDGLLWCKHHLRPVQQHQLPWQKAKQQVRVALGIT